MGFPADAKGPRVDGTVWGRHFPMQERVELHAKNVSSYEYFI